MARSLSPIGVQQDLSGRIFDIQSYSVHDGPGCRTLVFLSGCPLRCEWCANPEGLENRVRTLFRVMKCINRTQGCTRCIPKCPHQAISISDEKEIPLAIDWEKCRHCESHECVDACLQEAFVPASRDMKVSELMKIFDRDRHYWSGKGGATFSGGDPMYQKDFLQAVLKECRNAYIHTAIETSGFFPQETYLTTMKYVDFAFNDLKHKDSDKHKEKTGVPNELILANIAALAQSDWSGRLVLRSPVIEGFNDSKENMAAIAEFMHSVGLTEFNLLPFHRLGDSKWKSCGMVYPYSMYEATPPEKLEALQKVLLDLGIKAYVGSDTPF